jgi:hypothetical protein
MKLHVRGHYRNGSVNYAEGQVIEVSDAEGEFLQRDSPGTFAIKGAAALEDSTVETVTGIKAPDRRGRGGQRR